MYVDNRHEKAPGIAQHPGTSDRSPRETAPHACQNGWRQTRESAMGVCHFHGPSSRPRTSRPHDGPGWLLALMYRETSWLQQGDSLRLSGGRLTKSSPAWRNLPTVALSGILILRSDTNFCTADLSPSARRSPVYRAPPSTSAQPFPAELADGEQEH